MDPIRIAKAEELRSLKRIPYAAKFDRSHTLAEARSLADGSTVRIAGRIVLLRDMGKITFVTLQDHTGRLQLALKEDVLGAEECRRFLKFLDLGDFIGIEGERFTTQKGEPTVLIRTWTILSKALTAPPEKWHGLTNQEAKYRQRYLDTMTNRESLDRFLFRSALIRAMREFYWQHGFVEVDLPVLVNAASGALATPFTTHHEALDLDVYLRIALETHQKECLVGGFDRTFCIGPVFRNEGMDPSHLQEFTMCEQYVAYWDYRDTMRFAQEMFAHLLRQTRGSTVVTLMDRSGTKVETDFGGQWPILSLREVITRDCGIDFGEHSTADSLRSAIAAKGITLDVDVSVLGRGNLIDQLYKKVSRPKITQPTFITEHPLDLSPLARRNDTDPTITDRFQLVVAGWEIINAYSELVDPVDQAERFEQQVAAKEGGDSEAHCKDDEYVEALSYGCPPCSGWGVGIDRLVALLTQRENLKDVVLFPIMKPEERLKSTESTRNSKSPRSAGLRPAELRGGAERQQNSYEGLTDATAIDALVQDEKTQRFIAVLNKKVEPGKLMNALGHMAAGLGGGSGQADIMRFSQYLDHDGGIHPKISDYPFIVLAAENSGKIRALRQAAIERGISFTDFTDKMTVGSAYEQHQKMGSTPESELDYYGICLFGPTDVLKELTKKFSLFR